MSGRLKLPSEALAVAAIGRGRAGSGGMICIQANRITLTPLLLVGTNPPPWLLPPRMIGAKNAVGSVMVWMAPLVLMLYGPFGWISSLGDFVTHLLRSRTATTGSWLQSKPPPGLHLHLVATL